MKIKSISLNDEEMPQSVTVELTLREALFIVLAIGVNTYAVSEEIIKGGSDECSSIYSTLNSGLFSRFWHDGIDGAKEGEQGDGE